MYEVTFMKYQELDKNQKLNIANQNLPVSQNELDSSTDSLH